MRDFSFVFAALADCAGAVALPGNDQGERQRSKDSVDIPRG
jgi:hypothetical protein